MEKTTFNGFPIDGSYGSQIKYDLFVNYMSGAISSVSAAKSGDAGFIGLIVGLFQIILTIIVTILLLLGKLLFWIHYKLTKERPKNNISDKIIDDKFYPELEPDEINNNVTNTWTPLTNEERDEAIEFLKNK